MNQQIEKLLLRVQKPGRYVGGELNAVMKDRDSVDVRFAFCFPDTYEVGMSHLGMKILYSQFNEKDYIWCERVFAPWVDMEEEMRTHQIPLFALESQDPIKDFDFLGITIQYEMCYVGFGGTAPAHRRPNRRYANHLRRRSLCGEPGTDCRFY